MQAHLSLCRNLRTVAARAQPASGLRLHRPLARPLHRGMATSQGQKLDSTTPDSKWKELLSAEEAFRSSTSFPLTGLDELGLRRLCVQYNILRGKGTEAPGSGQYNKHKEAGKYTCAGCGEVGARSPLRSGWRLLPTSAHARTMRRCFTRPRPSSTPAAAGPRSTQRWTAQWTGEERQPLPAASGLRGAPALRAPTLVQARGQVLWQRAHRDHLPQLWRPPGCAPLPCGLLQRAARAPAQPCVWVCCSSVCATALPVRAVGSVGTSAPPTKHNPPHQTAAVQGTSSKARASPHPRTPGTASTQSTHPRCLAVRGGAGACADSSAAQEPQVPGRQVMQQPGLPAPDGPAAGHL